MPHRASILLSERGAQERAEGCTSEGLHEGALVTLRCRSLLLLRALHGLYVCTRALCFFVVRAMCDSWARIVEALLGLWFVRPPRVLHAQGLYMSMRSLARLQPIRLMSPSCAATVRVAAV